MTIIGWTAQRRPGREPRRHSHCPPRASAGCTALNEGRGVNPGDTPTRPRTRCRRTGTLNEGRGVNPGDTLPRAGVPVRDDRSTKAGA